MEVKCRKATIKGPDQVAKIFATINQANDEVDKMKEKFWVTGLSTRNRIEYIELVSLGTLNASLVHPREVFRFAIMKAVASIILCHNHPSGDPEVSQEDLSITKRLTEAGKIIGIDVLDHIVIGDGRFESMKEKGII